MPQTIKKNLFDTRLNRVSAIILLGVLIVGTIWGVFEIINSRPVAAHVDKKIEAVDAKVEDNKEAINDIEIRVELNNQKIERTGNDIGEINKNIESINIKLYDLSKNQGTMQGSLEVIEKHLLKVKNNGRSP